MAKKKKEKKEKIVYVDDGSTIADMSGVSRGPRLLNRNPARPPVRFKDAWSTYWGAVRMMFGPMLVFICAIGILYIILTAIFMFL